MGLGKTRTIPLGQKLSVLLPWALKVTWEHGEVGSIMGAITGGKPFVPPLYSYPLFQSQEIQFFLNCTSHPSIPIKVLLFFDISFFLI
jgi:hypothetical protein